MTSTLDTPVRYLPRAAVETLLPPLEQRLVLIESAYRALRDGTCEAPATPEISPRPGSIAHAMPAYVSEGDVTAVKWIVDNQANGERGLPLVSGLVIVNDSETGLPLAVMDAAAITVARTAAASAACVRAFANADWSEVGIIGFGVQAEAHIAALSELNPGASFRVFSRRRLTADNPRVSFVEGPRAAAEGPDVIITGRPLGTKLEPPVAAEWLQPSALVLPLDDDASLHADAVNRCELFLVDDPDDFRLRREHGIFAGWREPDGTVPDAVPEGRDVEGVIVCANQGMGVLDAVFARYVLEAAESAGAGALLER